MQILNTKRIKLSKANLFLFVISLFATAHTKCLSWDFPGGPVVKNPPSNAGNAGLIPGWGTKILHVTGQLSPCATTTEPACYKLQSPRALTTEPTHHN